MDQDPSGENPQDVQAQSDTIYRESDREYLSQGFLSTLSLTMIAGGWVWGLVRSVSHAWWLGLVYRS